jgi:hypothetical protein
MRWTVRDIDSYFLTKEYVDTALVPLVPVTWHREIKSAVAAGEFAALIVDKLEQQLKGRVIHFPPFTYLKSEAPEDRFERLHQWKQELLQDEMKYVFFITSDADWKSVESRMDESLTWIPAVPLEHMDADNIEAVLGGQIKQLLQIITIKWQNR